MTQPTPPEVEDTAAPDLPPEPVAPQTETQFVRMYHPELKVEADFPALSVGHHSIAGWQVIDEPPEADAEPEPEHISRADANAAQGITTGDADQGDDDQTSKPKTSTRRAGPKASDADNPTAGQE